MEHLFEYLKTSDPLHDVLYFSLFCIAIFFFLFIVIIAKKNGISFNFFGIFKGESSSKSDKKIEEFSKNTINDLEKIVTDIKFKLDDKNKEQIKNIESEKKELEFELNKIKTELEKNDKTIEDLKNENSILTKKVDLLDKEVKVLKLDKHPDVLIFGKVLYQLKTSLYELFTEILIKDHISKYKDNNEFEIYVKKRISLIVSYLKKCIENFYQGILIKNIDEIFTDNKNITFKNIYKDIYNGFGELRKISLYYNNIYQEKYKENLNHLENSLDSYFRNLSHDIKNKSSIIQNFSSEEIVKQFLKKETLLDLIIEVEINSTESNVNIRNEKIEKRKEICIRIIDSLLKNLEIYFKDKIVKTVLLKIKQEGE